MINRVVMTGRLTKDVELKTTQGGVMVCSFILAVDRRFKNQNGERESDFVNCIMWRKAAENFSKFTHKGSLVGIEGRIQTRNYENQQGQRVYVTEVVADDFSLLESKRDNQQPSYTAAATTAHSAAPAKQAPDEKVRDVFADAMEIDISNDDLPF